MALPTIETDYNTADYTEGRENPLEFIVIHHWGSTGQNFDNVKYHLSKEGDTSRVSAHYVAQGADADGTAKRRIARIVDESDTAWHAGNWDANTKSIGIECRPEARDADYDLVADLILDIRTRTGKALPLYPHKKFTATACPGVWDLTRLENLVQTKKKATTPVATAPCKRTTWRGVVVCEHSVPKLNKWAVAVGDGILLKPLPGCGSYQTTTTASAGTHAGGGAIDIDLRAVASTKRKWVADQGRLAGLQVAWHRNYVANLWTWHAHALDPACPNLAKAAVSQIVEYGNGGDGLVGSTPDGNVRTNVETLMFIFKTRLIQTVTAITLDGQVRLAQQAVHRPVNGYWDVQTDIDLRNTRSVAQEKFTGAFFKRWTLAQRKRMQKSWGAYEDGVWGPNTKAAAQTATKGIQGALGVTKDAIWGPVTESKYQALRKAKYTHTDLWKPVGAFPTPSTAGSMYGPSTAGKPYYSGKVAGKLTVAQIKWQISRIQRMVGAPVTSLYDANTVSKVKAWQKANSLTADGITGPATWAAMVKKNWYA